MSTVTYINQPGINASNGVVPLSGTDHPYKVLSVLWPEQVHKHVAGLLVGRTLHACCGKSMLGDVRLDNDSDNSPDILCDASNMREHIANAEFDTVLCDPPYNGKMQWNHDLLSELCRVASRRIVFQHWFVPVDNHGRYRKAAFGWGLTALYGWMPRTYFGRMQLISVFDADNLQSSLFI